MPSTRDIIATTGITTPVAALSFVVKPDEIFPAAELVVGLEEVIFEAEDTNVAVGNESAGSVDNSSPTPSQAVKLSREYNRSVALDWKAVGSAVAGLVIVYSGNRLKEEPKVVMQSPFDRWTEVTEMAVKTSTVELGPVGWSRTGTSYVVAAALTTHVAPQATTP